MTVLSKSMPIRMLGACSTPQPASPRAGTHGKKIVRHRVEAGVNDFVVHREHEDAREILLKQRLQLLAALAIDMTGLAERRGMWLRLDRWRADDQDPVRRERVAQIGDVSVLVRACDVFEDVETVESIVLFRQRTRDDVVDESLERPAGILARQNVLDEYRVKVVGGDLVHFLLNDPRTEGVAAAELADIVTPAQHLGDELVSCEQKRQTARIIVPNLVRHQAELGKAKPLLDLDAAVVLRLARRLVVERRGRRRNFRGRDRYVRAHPGQRLAMLVILLQALIWHFPLHDVAPFTCGQRAGMQAGWRGALTV